MVKLNLGCGTDYKQGWVNVDFNRHIKADVYADLSKKVPFEDNIADEILLDNALEHIDKNNFFWFMDEIYRVCKDGAIIRIYVPHFTSASAFKHLGHHVYFGISSFSIMDIKSPWNGERYNNARFKILKEELKVLHYNSKNFSIFNNLVKPLNWFFNFGGRKWKLIWEKFNIFGFEEMYFELKAVKNLEYLKIKGNKLSR